MTTLVASTLTSLLRRVAGPQDPALRNVPPAPPPWADETRPVVFRSEAFAEDLEDDRLVSA